MLGSDRHHRRLIGLSAIDSTSRGDGVESPSPEAPHNTRAEPDQYNHFHLAGGRRVGVDTRGSSFS